MFIRRFIYSGKISCRMSAKNVKASSPLSVAPLTRGMHDSSQATAAGDKQISEQQLYENAIKTLNSLQFKQGKKYDNFQKAEKFAERGKVPVEILHKLNAIHVSGTKGKGSVCAFCESILRNSGYKTGFYSSPHLVEVRERIRINGKPISKALFTRYFWECWNNQQKAGDDMPSYGAFMAFMAFFVFLKEKIDVAVVEVGLGGEYDNTNILRKPVVCGVTLLEKDHLRILGGTVESIAWHKAGIFKPGVPAFTVGQDSVSMKVLAERATERKTWLKVVPDISSYPGLPVLPKMPATVQLLNALGIEGKHQLQNASLAIHLCRTWIQRSKLEMLKQFASGWVIVEEYSPPLGEDLAPAKPDESTGECVSPSSVETYSPPTAEQFPIPESFKKGLSTTHWPGRSQCIERENLTFYLDGAHTERSIEACSSWFCGKSKEEEISKRPKRIARVLIFNIKGGERDSKLLLKPLIKCNFDYVVFCPNLLSEETQALTSDVSYFGSKTPEWQRQQCYIIQDAWKELLREHSANSCEMSKTLEENSRVFHCLPDAVYWTVGDRDPSITPPKPTSPLPDVISLADHVQIMVTGSLYLVGMVIKVLGPEIYEM